MKIDAYSAPLMVSWQLTKDCDLACLHCCLDCSPGKLLPGELSRREALCLASQIIEAGVPYVILSGGEPALCPHFFAVAQALGRGGAYLKVETNGQRWTAEMTRRLAALPVRSVQVSLDAATQPSYERLRPKASLDRVIRTCRGLHDAGLPLEVSFAPTRFNIREAGAVIDLALELGAFRFNTGELMCLGRAARLWEDLFPTSQDQGQFLKLLAGRKEELAGRMELCFRPFTLREGVREWLDSPPGTLSVQADGKVRVAAVLGILCADLKVDTLRRAWDAYRAACRCDAVRDAMRALLRNDLPVVV